MYVTQRYDVEKILSMCCIGYIFKSSLLRSEQSFFHRNAGQAPPTSRLVSQWCLSYRLWLCVGAQRKRPTAEASKCTTLTGGEYEDLTRSSRSCRSPTGGSRPRWETFPTRYTSGCRLVECWSFQLLCSWEPAWWTKQMENNFRFEHGRSESESESESCRLQK